MAYKSFFDLRFGLAMSRIEYGRAHERGYLFCITVTQNEPYFYALVVTGLIRKIAKGDY
jgi:hypothetical protein